MNVYFWGRLTNLLMCYLDILLAYLTLLFFLLCLRGKTNWLIQLPTYFVPPPTQLILPEEKHTHAWIGSTLNP